MLEVKKEKWRRESEAEGNGLGMGNKGTKLNTERRDWEVLLQRDAAESETTAAIYSNVHKNLESTVVV